MARPHNQGFAAGVNAGWRVARSRWLLVLNPLTGIIEGYRSALFNRPFEWQHLAVSAVLGIGMLVYGTYSFKQMEREFADII